MTDLETRLRGVKTDRHLIVMTRVRDPDNQLLMGMERLTKDVMGLLPKL